MLCVKGKTDKLFLYWFSMSRDHVSVSKNNSIFKGTPFKAENVPLCIIIFCKKIYPKWKDHMHYDDFTDIGLCGIFTIFICPESLNLF